MREGVTLSAPPRIVFWTRDESLLRGVQDVGAEVVAVSDGYQAAAELLLDPPAGLAVDLRRLTGRHMALLDLADHLGVKVFVTGDWSFAPHIVQPEGVTHVAAESLAEQLCEAISASESPRRADTGPAPAGTRFSPPGGAMHVEPGSLLSAEELSALLEASP